MFGIPFFGYCLDAYVYAPQFLSHPFALYNFSYARCIKRFHSESFHLQKWQNSPCMTNPHESFYKSLKHLCSAGFFPFSSMEQSRVKMRTNGLFYPYFRIIFKNYQLYPILSLWKEAFTHIQGTSEFCQSLSKITCE